MADSVFQIIEGSQLVDSATSRLLLTRGLITNIQADSDPDPEIIWRAKTACEAAGYVMGSALNVLHPEMIYQQLVIRGFTNNGCIVELRHETPVFGGAATALILRNRSYVSSINTNMYRDTAGNVHGIRVPGITIEGEQVGDDLGTISMLKPMRARQVFALTYGQPANGGEDAVGFVNNANWQSKPPGFWLMTEFETDISRYSGYYTMQATAITQVTHPWVYFSTLQSRQTGRYAQIAAAEIANLGNLPYLPGSLTQATGGGMVRVDPYLFANFAAIFGIN